MQFPKELRISLTNKCNYKCIFCHNEGLNNNVSIKNNLDTIFKIIDIALDNNVEDITFTGGEPLLSNKKIKLLNNFISYIRKNGKNNPHITVVTNAAHLNKEQINFYKDIENFKFNISIHSFDDKKYKIITAQERYSLYDVLNNIEYLHKNNINFKINYVLLKGLNNRKEEILNAIYKSKEIGAKSIKFIELLIPESKEYLFNKYIEVNSIYSIFRENLILKSIYPRKGIYEYKDNNLNQIVELVKCTCKEGCNQCHQNRPFFVDLDGNYYPCFINEEYKLNFRNEKNINKILEQGYAFIDFMSKKYEDMSPILNNEAKLTSEKLYTFFIIDKETFYKIKNDKEFLKTRYFSQKYFLYKPAISNYKWDEYQKTVRIMENFHNPEKAALIISDNSYFQIENLIFEKIKFKKEKNFSLEGKKEELETLLKNLDFKLAFNFKIEGFFLIKDYVRLSIGKINLKNRTLYTLMIFVYGSPEEELNKIKNLIKNFNVKILDKPLFKTLEKITNS